MIKEKVGRALQVRAYESGNKPHCLPENHIAIWVVSRMSLRVGAPRMGNLLT